MSEIKGLRPFTLTPTLPTMVRLSCKPPVYTDIRHPTEYPHLELTSKLSRRHCLLSCRRLRVCTHLLGHCWHTNKYCSDISNTIDVMLQGNCFRPNLCCVVRMCQKRSARGVQEPMKGGFARMYASLGCGSLSARCTAGTSALGYFCFLGRDARICRNPLG